MNYLDFDDFSEDELNYVVQPSYSIEFDMDGLMAFLDEVASGAILSVDDYYLSKGKDKVPTSSPWNYKRKALEEMGYITTSFRGVVSLTPHAEKMMEKKSLLVRRDIAGKLMEHPVIALAYEEHLEDEQTEFPGALGLAGLNETSSIQTVRKMIIRLSALVRAIQIFGPVKENA